MQYLLGNMPIPEWIPDAKAFNTFLKQNKMLSQGFLQDIPPKHSRLEKEAYHTKYSLTFCLPFPETLGAARL